MPQVERCNANTTDTFVTIRPVQEVELAAVQPELLSVAAVAAAAAVVAVPRVARVHLWPAWSWVRCLGFR